MMKTLFTAAAMLVAVPVLADEVRMSAPIEAGSLDVRGLALVAYYTPVGDDAFEVTATWIGDEDTEPSRLVMVLAEGDEVAFALPGHADTMLTFTREFEAVAVRAEPAGGELRNASL